MLISSHFNLLALSPLLCSNKSGENIYKCNANPCNFVRDWRFNELMQMKIILSDAHSMCSMVATSIVDYLILYRITSLYVQVLSDWEIGMYVKSLAAQAKVAIADERTSIIYAFVNWHHMMENRCQLLFIVHLKIWTLDKYVSIKYYRVW